MLIDCKIKIALIAITTLSSMAMADITVSSPDRVVYVPEQPKVKKAMDPRKLGDSYNDHFQVLYDHSRKQYYAFWTQASWEGAGDHHICFAKSKDGKTWSKPDILAGSRCRSIRGFDASWQQPMLSKTGRLYCLWNQLIRPGKSKGEALCGFYSDDGGDTWTEPRFVPVAGTVHDKSCVRFRLPWINWQRPLRLLEDGKFAVAASMYGKGRVVCLWRFENIDDNPEIADVKITVNSRSNDLCVARMVEKDVFHPDDGRDALEEGSMVKLPDGRLFMLMRTSTGHPAWSVSSDVGCTWSDPKHLRDSTGRAYLQPRSPCPIYDYNGCETGSGVYFAMIHDTFDFEKKKTAYQNRGPVYIIWGEYDPNGEQPIKFTEKRMLNPRTASWNSYYTSYTVVDGERILWYPDGKHYLLGKIITRP